MARRRTQKWWHQLPTSWASIDRTRDAGMPFDFIHRTYLNALGVARELRDGSLALDLDGLAGYRPPAGAADALSLAAVEKTTCDPITGELRTYTVVEPSSGTRLDPVAAAWL